MLTADTWRNEVGSLAVVGWLVKAENVRSVTPRIHWLDAPGEQETENVRSVTPRIHWFAHFTLR